MAVFRCVENRVPAARATASGQTVFIDPNGKINAMAAPFSKTYLTGTIPVVDGTKKTLYTMYGDYTGKFFAAAGSILLAAGFAVSVYKKAAEKKRNLSANQ